jgi:hypothetical protein
MTMDRESVAALSPEQLRQIDELCEAMDREHIPASMWFAPGEPAYPLGGTILDACRALWIERAQQSLPLPKHWWSDSKSGGLVPVLSALVVTPFGELRR